MTEAEDTPNLARAALIGISIELAFVLAVAWWLS